MKIIIDNDDTSFGKFPTKELENLDIEVIKLESKMFKTRYELNAVVNTGESEIDTAFALGRLVSTLQRKY